MTRLAWFLPLLCKEFLGKPPLMSNFFFSLSEKVLLGFTLCVCAFVMVNSETTTPLLCLAYASFQLYQHTSIQHISNTRLCLHIYQFCRYGYCRLLVFYFSGFHRLCMKMRIQLYHFRLSSVQLSFKIKTPDVGAQKTIPTNIAKGVVLKTSPTVRFFKMKNQCSTQK